MISLRSPVRQAVATSLFVLVVYLITLAPTVTFWDAGEFITAARTLGIPHPPGAPLFVLLASVWGRLVPLGEFAWRTNLLSAICTAAASGCWFLVAHDMIRRLHPEIDDRSRSAFAFVGGAAVALMMAFSYTAWQSATETEVYATTTLSVALIALIATRWRTCRTELNSSRLLLAALYLGALSIGSHLMGVLVGPALIAAVAVEARHAPLAGTDERRAEWARIFVVAAAWVLICGIGLGNGLVVVAGAVALVAAGLRAASVRQVKFALTALVVVAIGVSTFAFLLLRAKQHPWLNSGDPGTWQNLLDVVRRAQYPVRSPFDDPTVLHGPGNPGRTLALIGYQIANYAQHFDWQWASSLGDMATASIPRLVVTLVMATLGVRGAFAQRRGDPASFAFVATIFLVTGPLLVLYLNFKPGPSIGWDRWLNGGDHEVRDRDYFFVASFVAWSVWVAIALVDLVRRLIPQLTGSMRTAALGVFAVAVIPLLFNFSTATRRQSADATLARDFAHALLESVPVDAVLFTNGDNDTFPLLYAQQVEGFRPDVTIVCLSMAQSRVYLSQISSLYDLPVDDVARQPFRAPRDLTLDFGTRGTAIIHASNPVFPVDILVFEILRKNVGKRPIAWSITAGNFLYGLGPGLVQQGMALIMSPGPADSTALVGGAAAAPGGTPLDLVASRRLIESWQFGALDRKGPERLDANIRAVASTIATPMTQTGIALVLRGDTAAGVAMLQRAVRVGNDSAAMVALRRVGR